MAVTMAAPSIHSHENRWSVEKIIAAGAIPETLLMNGGASALRCRSFPREKLLPILAYDEVREREPGVLHQ